MEEEIIKIIKRALKEFDIDLKGDEIERIMEIPPNHDMGDYAFPCFFLSKQLKDEPHQIALQLREKIGNYPQTIFEDIQVQGPYINFFIDRKELARKAVWDILTKKDDYGKTNLGKNKKVIIDFSAPNIAKPFGISHLRSTIVGNSLANICDFFGFNVKRINYLGDWGTQFGKLLLGYEKFGNEEKLKKNPMKHLLEIYVKANKKQYDEKAREWFKKLEDGDKKAQMLWRVFRELSLEHFKQVYKTLGIKFDVYSGESFSVKKADKALKELEEKKLVRKSQNALIVDLKSEGLGVCIIKKSNEGTTYALRDIAEAIDRKKKYDFFRSIYQVGQEQRLYFKQVFRILELMEYSWAKDCIHSDHGFYLDKHKKKFATRKGKTVLFQEVLDKTVSLAKKEIRKRDKKLSEKKLEQRALKIAIAAIIYGDLKNNKSSNIVFDLNRFISFDGDTGPYILYSYARASSIMKKTKTNAKFEIKELHDKEVKLIKKLLEFPKIVLNSYNNLNPSLIANYVYQLSQIFNDFYHSCQVVGSKEESFRMALVEAFRTVTRNSLKLLGIETIEEM
ncbi:MAG: arginine--tRNA ligase [Candidatus Pacearchaeota archaeon]